MKPIFFFLLAACLLSPASTFAGTTTQDPDQLSPMAITLQGYRAEGYTVIGPVQYLDRTKGFISFYRQSPVAYTRLRVINAIGIPTSIKRGDFVYLLSKKGRIILIRLKQKENKNA